jgi:hypothetical protein
MATSDPRGITRNVLPIASNIDTDAVQANLATLAAVGESLAAAIALPPATAAAFTKWDRTLDAATAAVRRHMAWRQRHPTAYARANLDATPEHLRWDLRAARHLGRFRAALVALRPAPWAPREVAILHLATLATARVNRWQAPTANPSASSIALVATRPSHGPPLPA